MGSLVYRVLAALLVCATASAESDGSDPANAKKAAGGTGSPGLHARIQEIMSRPEFEGARWGMKFLDPGAKQEVYALNSDQLFQPASSMKVFVAGTAFDALGPDYRFRTRVYRTGPVEDGVLRGDLVLVASGDLLLGGRVQGDGALALPETDHTYDMHPDAVPVSDDPLRSIKEIAGQIAANGIRRVQGRVVVDASLFREQKGEAGGTGKVTISPIVINDNQVDVIVKPGNREGEPGTIRVLPETAYVTVVNRTKTAGAQAPPTGGVFRSGPGILRVTEDVTNADGTHTVALTGNVPQGSRPVLCAYRVPEPARFAEMVLAEALRAKGIPASADLLASPDFQSLATHYTPDNLVAEIVSPPLSDEVKPMLKLSSNPQTLHWPYLVGAIAGHDKETAYGTGKEFQQRLFAKAGVAPAGTKPGEGLGSDRYSADAFIQFLTYMAQQRYFAEYRRALPVMGRDGSLCKVQVNSPAAGHVYAKTGTAIRMSVAGPNPGATRHRPYVATALAGYIELPGGRLVAFAEFLEMEGTGRFKGIDPFQQVMGEIANAVYESLASPSR